MHFKLSMIIILLFCVVNWGFAAPAFHPERRHKEPKEGFSKGVAIYPKKLPDFRQGTTDTLNIAVIRVDFQLEDPDNPKTQGNGKMDLVADYPDSTPHDRSYFSEIVNIRMDAYFKQVSYGQLRIRGDVFPLEEEVSYTMPQTIAYYGGQDEQSLAKSCELLQEAITQADDDIDFSLYDGVFVFHAGAGEEGAPINKDYSDEIWTTFIELKNLKKHLGNDDEDYLGISTNDDVYIQEALLLPETETHDPVSPENPSNLLGLLGVCCHEFGHQLGWIDLYNTENPLLSLGIGEWGLMAYGAWTGLGFFPAHPCAYTRTLGFNVHGDRRSWVDIREYDYTAEDIELYQINSPKPETGRGEVVKIPVTDTEYFLLANRQPDANHDGSHNGGFDGYDFEDYYSAEFDFRTPSPPFGPASGLLIWHIDEEIIQANWASNTVNTDRDPKGVDLEEADGRRDLDFNANGGDSLDPFYAPWKTEFSNDTNPSASTNHGSQSALRIYGISESDSIMVFSTSFINQKGWPRTVGDPDFNINVPLVADLDNDDISEIVVTALDTMTVSDGDSIYLGKFSEIYVLNSEGETIWRRNLGETVVQCTPSAGNIDDDADLEIFVGTKDGRVFGWNPNGSLAFGNVPFVQLQNEIYHSAPTMFDSIVTTEPQDQYDGIVLADFGDEESEQKSNLYFINRNGIVWNKEIDGYFVESSPAVADIDNDGYNNIILANWEGYVFALDHQGNQLWKVLLSDDPIRSSPIIADLDRTGDDKLEIAIPGGDGKIYVLDAAGNVMEGWPQSSGGNVTATLSLGDLDEDGYLEIIAPTRGDWENTKVLAFNHSGSLTEHWDDVNVYPLEMQDYWPGLRSSAAIGDLDGDDEPEIVVGTPDGRVLGWHNDGTKSDIFPLAASGEIAASPVITDVDNDGDVELIAKNTDGKIFIWDLQGDYSPNAVLWSTFQKDIGRTGYFNITEDGSLNSPATISERLLSNSYCYPNPTNPERDNYTTIRYSLKESAEVTITIFNLAGELIDEFDAPGVGNVENEIRWDISHIASGVYLARIGVKTDNGDAYEFIKIGVVK